MFYSSPSGIVSAAATDSRKREGGDRRREARARAPCRDVLFSLYFPPRLRRTSFCRFHTPRRCCCRCHCRRCHRLRSPAAQHSIDRNRRAEAYENRGTPLYYNSMPTSMTASHGGVLYYVVKVPKDDPTSPDYVSATASHKYLEEKRTLSPLNLEWEFTLFS